MSAAGTPSGVNCTKRNLGSGMCACGGGKCGLDEKTHGGAAQKPAGQMYAIEVAMMRIELSQLRKGAAVMALHILSQPAAGADALSEARRIANEVVAAESIAAADQSRGPA